MSRRKRMMKDLDQDIRDFIERETQDNVERGMSSEEARNAALRKFGNVTRVKEETWELWSFVWLEQVWQDVRFGLRVLRKSFGFTCVAVLTLALGIGAITAIFSIVDAVLLRSLPFRSPSSLIALHEGLPKMGYPKMSFSPPDYAIFARHQRSFASVGVFRDEHVDISGEGEPERITAARVSASLFPILGAEPILGRNFTPEEDTTGHNVTILSYALWQRRFGGEASVIGRTIQLDRQPYTVIGIMGSDFEFPLAGPADNGSPAALWVPMALTPAELQGWGGSYFNSVVGRLRPGVSLNHARAEAQSLAQVIVAGYPGAIADFARHGELTIIADPFQEEVVGSVRTLLLVLMAAVAFVLLIACGNVATLLLSRAAGRQKEIAVRTALGAGRVRLLRQMLTESLLLALAGGALGLIVAFLGKDLILAVVPASVPLPRQIALNGTVFAFALAASLLSSLLFGLVPAFQVSAANVQKPLQEGGRSGSGNGSHRLQGFFVTAEFAMALILLVGAGLLIRSFAKLISTDPGFRPDHVLALNIPLPRQAYASADEVREFYKQLLEQASNLPGVNTAGISSDLPLNASELVSMTIERGEGATRPPEAIAQSWVLGNYFQTMGIPLVRGRFFGPEDRLENQPAAIVSASLAKKAWPGQDALGKRIRWGLKDPWATIVGVVGDVNQGPLNAPLAPHVYRPYDQLPAAFLENDPFGDWHALNLALRTQADSASLASAVIGKVHSLDRDLAVTNIWTMTQVINSSMSGSQFNAFLVGTFAGLALFLAAFGVYGVLAYAVARRTHEIGIRMALGATKGDVFRLVLRKATFLTLLGIVIGWAGSLSVTRLLESLLYGVRPTDPLTFAIVSVTLGGVAALAAYIPARRANKVDPMVALRYE